MSDEVERTAALRMSVSVSASAAIGRRDYYSTHLLFAAHLSASQAKDREAHLAGSDPRFDARHRASVITALVAASAFLEAAINEVLQDAADDHVTPKIANVTARTRRLWSAYWLGLDSGRRGEVLEKYQAALELADCEKFNEGAEPFQGARLLLRSRNLILHFKPETAWSDAAPDSLVSGLATRVPRNPQVAGDASPTSIEDLLSAGCAAWAVQAAHALTEVFASRTNTELNYQVALPSFLADEPDLPQL